MTGAKLGQRRSLYSALSSGPTTSARSVMPGTIPARGAAFSVNDRRTAPGRTICRDAAPLSIGVAIVPVKAPAVG